MLLMKWKVSTNETYFWIEPQFVYIISVLFYCKTKASTYVTHIDMLNTNIFKIFSIASLKLRILACTVYYLL